MSNWIVHGAVITALAPGPPTVEVAAPEERVIVDRDTFPGRFDAVESVEVRPRVGGYIDSVNFKDGDTVRKGDLLFAVREVENALAGVPKWTEHQEPGGVN